MTSHDQPTTVDLSILELVCSRLCHDMVGPIGAATNGIELLREVNGGLNDDIIDMTDASARIAWRRLEFFRVAFGYAGGRDGWGVRELGKLAQGMLMDGKVQLDWQAAPEIDEIWGRGGKLLLNMVLLMAEAMPRGGTLAVHLALEGERLTAKLCGEGRNAALHPRVASTVQGTVPPGELDSRVILAHLAQVQIRDAGAEATWQFGEDRVDLTLSLPQNSDIAAAAE